jgi:hypothetical protein
VGIKKLGLVFLAHELDANKNLERGAYWLKRSRPLFPFSPSLTAQAIQSGKLAPDLPSATA